MHPLAFRHVQNTFCLYRLQLLTLITLLLSPVNGHAETIRVAVAANFAQTAESLANRFESMSVHNIEFSVASTGKLFQQIRLGAPFDYFLAADRSRPEQLDALGRSIPDTRFTYALGQITWVQTQPFTAKPSITKPSDGLNGTGNRPQESKSVTTNKTETPAQNVTSSQLPINEKPTNEKPTFPNDGLMTKRVAIANPAFAPYGIAAQAFIEATNLSPEKVVMGDNVAQTWHYVVTRQVDAAVVSVSQYQQYRALGRRNGISQRGFRPLYNRAIPLELYPAIEQQALMLKESDAIRSWHSFLQSDEAARIVKTFGYRPASDIALFAPRLTESSTVPSRTALPESTQ